MFFFGNENPELAISQIEHISKNLSECFETNSLIIECQETKKSNFSNISKL